MFEGDRRFDIVVRLPETLRTDLDALRQLPISLPAKEGSGTTYFPPREGATLDFTPGGAHCIPAPRTPRLAPRPAKSVPCHWNV